MFSLLNLNKDFEWAITNQNFNDFDLYKYLGELFTCEHYSQLATMPTNNTIFVLI